MASLRVSPLDVQPYRGFRLGYATGLHGYLPAWRSSLDSDWIVSHVYADDFADIERLARECIDFRYRQGACEVLLGRPLTIDELKDCV